MQKYILDNTRLTVSGTEFRRGIAVALDMEKDEMAVTVDEELYEAVPVFYKCAGEGEMLSNGSVKGSAAAFAEGDDVTVCFIRGVPLVTGFIGGAKPCFRNRLAYPAPDGGYFIAPQGEIIPTEFVTAEDFANGYKVAEALPAAGSYLIQTVEGVVDECISFKDHTFRHGSQELLNGREYTDTCKIDRWGRWFSLHTQCSYEGLDACFYEVIDTVITGGTEWTVDRYFRFAQGSEFIQIAHQLEDWRRSPTYYGEKIRSFNAYYGGKAEQGAFMATSCVTGTQTEDTGFNVYLLTEGGLREEKFPVGGGVADMGIGTAYPSMILVRAR